MFFQLTTLISGKIQAIQENSYKRFQENLGHSGKIDTNERMRYSRELPPKGISLRMPLTAERLCAAVDVCGVLLVIKCY